jgi:hypothetical protein
VGPTVKEEVLGQGSEIMKERLSGLEYLAKGSVLGIDHFQERVSQEGQEVQRQ